MKKRSIFSVITGIVSLGLAVSITVGIKSNDKPIEGQAVTATHPLRVWAVLKSAWDNNSTLHIHYYNGSNAGTTWGNLPKMTRVLSDYYTGLWYYDLPYNDYKNIVFACASSGSYGKNSNQTVDLVTSSFTNKAAFIDEWKADGTKRAVSYGTLGSSAAQLAEILSYKYYQPCSSSYTSGYNAYPQFKTIFEDVIGSDVDLNTQVQCSATTKTTIRNQINQLKTQYNRYNDPDLANIIAESTVKNSGVIAALISLVTLSTISFLIIKSRKRKEN